jgi:pimeloyl-ACP methyl ester carboxylesterase
MKLLWSQLLTVDLFNDAIKAPSKELIWFEKSAHMINSEDKDEFNRILVDRILPSIMN